LRRGGADVCAPRRDAGASKGKSGTNRIAGPRHWHMRRISTHIRDYGRGVTRAAITGDHGPLLAGWRRPVSV